MFTGIVEEVGRVVSISGTGMTVRAERVMSDLKLGDSIAVNGACLTAVSLSGGEFSVDLSPETTRRTALGDLTAGGAVNLERALSASDRMGGHIVQGHVDATGSVASMEQEGDSTVLEIAAPEGLMRYIVEKGFIAVDGISLTVVKVENAAFTLAVIPYTLRNTNLGTLSAGARVNLEADILAKYVENLLKR